MDKNNSKYIIILTIVSVLAAVTVTACLNLPKNNSNKTTDNTQENSQKLTGEDRFIGRFNSKSKYDYDDAHTITIEKDHTCKDTYYDSYPYTCTWEAKDENTIVTTVEGIGGLKQITVGACENVKQEKYADKDEWRVYIYPEDYAKREGFACTVAPVIQEELKYIDDLTLDGFNDFFNRTN